MDDPDHLEVMLRKRISNQSDVGDSHHAEHIATFEEASTKV